MSQENVEDAYREVVTARQRPAPAPGAPITEQDLRQVAKIHDQAVTNDDNPAERNCEVKFVSKPTAYRWISRAKKEGHIRPGRNELSCGRAARC